MLTEIGWISLGMTDHLECQINKTLMYTLFGSMDKSRGAVG